jgi:hypothetical protein
LHFTLTEFKDKITISIDEEKAFLQNSRRIYDKNSYQFKYRKNVPQHNEEHLRQPIF